MSAMRNTEATLGSTKTPSQSSIRYVTSIKSLSDTDRLALFDRSTSSDEAIRATTDAIIKDVRNSGDEALKAMALQFDGVQLDAIEVPKEKWEAALKSLDPKVRQAMERSVKNIKAVHSAFVPTTIETEPEPGIRIGRRPDPLNRVGVYAPGGRAAYPSSVLMGAIPARVAGVQEVILCSPPNRDGLPSPVVLAAAALAQVDRVFALGGAGAIAAMAYGTKSVPRVDRIVGPGNAYVAEAKLQVSGAVAIDSPAGPSELLVVADASVDPDVVAKEVMAQAEHDPQAVVIVVAIGEDCARSLQEAITRVMPQQERREIIEASLETRGGVLIAETIEEVAEFSNAFAPEHLLLAIENAKSALPRFLNAGTVFVGATSSVAYGDYMTGANHVLPTGGLARSYSGLSTLDFIRWTTYQTISRDAASRLAEDVGVFADSEGLPGHAATARQWKSQS